MAVSKAARRSDLSPLLRTHELHAACRSCCKKKAEITFCLVERSHQCQRNILLAKQIGTDQWRPVNPVPPFPIPIKYVVCWNFKEGSGCRSHGTRCSFARSSEEATVWNFLKNSSLGYSELINMLKSGTKSQSQSVDQCGGTDSILSQFPGKFFELCEICFHSSPQRISRKSVVGHPSPCCTSKHRWKPLLVHCKETQQNMVEYHEIRPLPNKAYSQWRYCRYVESGQPCWHGARRCWFAHSKVEMAVWTEESQRPFDRSRLLGNDVPKSHGARANSASPVKQQKQSQSMEEHYCKVCQCKFRSREEYMNHCFTREHRQLIFEDGCRKGQYRDPPQTCHSFKLCQRPYSCEHGDRCMEAHSVEELEEWRSRARAARKKANAAEEQGLLSYQDRLLEEFRTSTSPGHIISETVRGVTTNCESDLSIYVHKEKVPVMWKFKVVSKNALAEIALLKQEPGASFTLGENINEHRTYSTGDWYICTTDVRSKYSYEVTVSFVSTCPGVYEQWLVFDFDTRPVLLHKLLVRVGMPPSSHIEISEEYPVPTHSVAPNLRLWNRGIRVIVPYFSRAEAEIQLLKEFKPPAMNPQYCQLMEDCVPINHHNYKERMHSFLYQEEQAEEEIVCRLNLHGTITLSNTLNDVRFGLKIACDGELFGTLPVCHALTPDTPEGFMLKRGVESVLVGEVTANDQGQQVYEAVILRDTASVKEIHLRLSRECCSDLGLQKNQTREMEVQFQLNRLWFCEMHKAIDLLPDLQYVLPDFSKTCVPVHSTKYPSIPLNEKQHAAMSFILGDPDDRNSVAPLLIYGPFGTGKTYTLAEATVELMKEEHNRVLICTHTNSSADLYVKDHFHKHIEAGNLKTKPLRIKAKEVSPISTHHITRGYCLLTEDGHFKFPDKETVDLTRIVITTTGVARLLHDLKLPKDYFSHIMIDEASQMLECEALMALGLAGPKTRIVLAGDHMQMGPKLFSVEDDKRSDHTLLNRLFYYYQSEKKNVALESRIIFNENYRSTKGIVDFVSTYFYFDKCQKKQQTTNGIKASGNVAAHPTQHPLMFSHVRGECHLDTTTMSWYNPEQIIDVVQIVQDLLYNWPEEWKQSGIPPDPSTICILSQGTQVFHLRTSLKQVHLRSVTVENAENVQGKQFRVIIIVTVHTRDTLKPSASSCLEFFNDARVLNTAMTRAQSQVIVVGDAAALCYFGRCAKTWRCYIEHCIENGSAKPEHLNKDFLNQEVTEISRFQIPSQEEDTSDTDSTTSEMPDIDPILQELLDESNDWKVNVTEEGLLDIFKNDHPDKTPDDNEEKDHGDQSDEENEFPSIPNTNGIHKRCIIVMEIYHSAYAIPLDEPTSRINIKGRKNFHCCFPGDEVLVEVLSEESTPPTGRVHRRVGTASLLNKKFVCTIDKYDNQVMIPINKCISKIYTPFFKYKPHHIAVRKGPKDLRPQEFVKINEETKRNLFVVQLLRWGENFHYPLGIVVKVLPKVTSLEDGLQVLNTEYQLSNSPSLCDQEMIRLQECSQDFRGRKDFRSIITFTIDPSHSRDHDDAISVRDLGPDYEIGIHIADVAHFVPKGSGLDEYAKKQGLVFYPPETTGTPVYIFPRELSEDVFSLLPGCVRHTISLMVVIDKKTHHIKSADFHLSVICSNRKLSYDEAEEILKTSRTKDSSGEPCFNTVEGCLLIASHFSEVHRKDRKQDDWCYKTPDEDTIIGSRQSHRVVEELMILFNHSVAQLLLNIEKTKSCVPLRCQERPDMTGLGQLRERCSPWLPLSIHLSHLMEDEGGLMSLPEASRSVYSPGSGARQQCDADSSSFLRYTSLEPDTFSVLTSLLENLQTAGKEGDIQRIVDLITTDDVHPQLLPIVRAFRKLIRRAHVIRSNSTLTSRVGHFDLDLDCYSWASSPIRRYLDIITQRILHSVLEGKEITYSPIEIDQACVSFSLQFDKGTKYERTSNSLNFASELIEQSARKIAYITDIPPNGNSFRLSFPLQRKSMCDDVDIMYRDLHLADQPWYDGEQNCRVIKWSRRVYSMLRDDIHSELERQVSNSLITHVSREAWICLLSTIREEKWEDMLQHLQDVTSEVRQGGTFSSTESCEDTVDCMKGHFVELSLKLKQGDTIEVQLGTDTVRGLLVPAVQLLIVNPNFEICLEHTKNPIECFSRYALRASKDVYSTYNEYQKIWMPLCEMESACNAVAEKESIVLEDVELTWTQVQKDHNLQGFFQLPLEKKKQWSIECDFRKCFLCIRMRRPDNDFQPEKQHGDKRLTEAKYLDLTSMTNVIWIAHGVTTKTKEEEKTKEEDEDEDEKSIKIHFRINHLPMANRPQRIFLEGTRFTVELIPKLLPDVRKEEAIKRLTKANQLVKDIALGKQIHLEGIKIIVSKSGTFDMENHRSFDFPPLNTSQNEAIRETLRNHFTLIQGPPGTGKTVVGVHIVYWFLKQSQMQRPRRNKEESEKKRCILYCGPSNKSVDVVAGQLLKLSAVLRPLRVYSEQMEVMDYPYPGSSLKLSRHSLRGGKPNEDLRSITLHHRMRKADNPHSSEIRAFDARIKRGENLTEDEIRSYKRVLKMARKHELLKHDVILCTCTAASNPNFGIVKLQQIIIDECAMATEPEALIPLVTHQPEQIVLIGDHKQLKPVVTSDVVERLGMSKSLFERYMKKAMMLDIQYRMHEDICEFPSQQFYGGNLKTGERPNAKPSVLLTASQHPTPILFGHVEGKEVSLMVATEKGNENSKANLEEAEQTVQLATLLINQSGIDEEHIAILTPYNAQVAKIKETLLKSGIYHVTVSTIMKSQGSEWRYIILSTVRSCPKSEIDSKPTKSWLMKKLGFVMDPNQVNVGITRAQEGLCIIGNQTLLQCSCLWKRLLNHYQEKGCVVNPAQSIRVQRKIN
ncbi:helicase with zinc finger domain 2 isoform X1 [Alosa sapidissima]|uniref:helicase with zinc finger domain 2 isoform X1 n=1 Tax=Alosa sapidissima TaxID=34773 RepID=UPI001C085797|nr:helicase with zinc finger domain 2 isoform X1 [Alosa sapidissima]XP_041945273.1 helicase with zinc finger domain 2 isoform X1 [Alosa sapidissima]